MDLPKVYFYGNEQLLDQVWVNILDNAIKHSPLESSIHICLCSKEQELSVSITDEGEGMSEDVQKHVFEKFYQGDTSRMTEGNGLGMALVKRSRLMQRHGGYRQQTGKGCDCYDNAANLKKFTVKDLPDMEDTKKEILFEKIPIPRAVMALAIPTIISSLVMVIYNLADTYFVGMLNDPVQNAAVTLAAPVLLAFNAVNNLFGVGSSSMMSRALGKRDYDTVYRSSAFGFYGSLFCGFLFSLIYSLFSGPLLTMLGAGMDTIHATGEYLKWTVTFGAVPAF